MSDIVNLKPDNQRISILKVITVVTIILVVVVMFGVYQGYKQNRLDTIEEVAKMKLSHGWKPDKACMFLVHLGINPKGYFSKNNDEIFECHHSLKMPYSKGEASLQYRVVGVEDSATKVSLVLAITDNMATKPNNDAQNEELKQFKEIFYGIANDILFVGAGRGFSEKEYDTLRNIKLADNVKVDSMYFDGSLQHYKVKNGLHAYSFDLMGKEALQLPSKNSGAVQKNQ